MGSTDKVSDTVPDAAPAAAPAKVSDTVPDASDTVPHAGPAKVSNTVPDAGPDAGPDAPAAPPPKRRRIGLKIALALLLLLALAAGIAAMLLPGWIRAEIIRQARARGVELDPGAVAFSLEAVTLQGARFTLIDAPGVEGEIRQATIAIEGLRPARVALEGLSLSLTGLSGLDALHGWVVARHAALGELPLSARGVRVGLRDARDAPERAALLTPAVAVASPIVGGLEVPVRGARVTLAGREVAQVDGTARLDGSGLSARFATTILPATPGGAVPPPVQVELRRPPAADLTVRLPKTTIDALTTPLGLAVRAPGVSVAGTFEVRLPRIEGALVEATADLSLEGYLPPHPKELDGILYGKTTTAKTRARMALDAQRVELQDLEVAAGALTLRGAGDVRREPADAVLTLTLSGAVPCSLLTHSAVEAHLGQEVGELAGALARRALAGSVSVQARIEARASRFDAPRVETSAVVGCRLKLL